MSIAPGYRGTNNIMEDFAKRNQCDNMKSLETQIGGNHYKDMAIQPTEFIHANGLGFIVGCIVKYVCRYKLKNGKQDLQKARHFIDMLIELEYGQGQDKSGDSEERSGVSNTIPTT